jgi:hypothetical protein
MTGSEGADNVIKLGGQGGWAVLRDSSGCSGDQGELKGEPRVIST